MKRKIKVDFTADQVGLVGNTLRRLIEEIDDHFAPGVIQTARDTSIILESCVLVEFFNRNLSAFTIIQKRKLTMYAAEVISLKRILTRMPLRSGELPDVTRNQLLDQLNRAFQWK